MKTSRQFDSPTPDPNQFLLENMLNGFAHCQMHFEQGQPRDFTYLRVNPAFENLTGLKNVVGKRVSEVIPRLRESDPEVFEMYGRVASTGVPEQMETFVAAMGIWFSIAAYSPKRGHFVAVFDVITERKQAEIELRRLNRSLRTISECNQILVRAENETDLLNQVCESLVKEGGYRLAWVGFAENDEGKTVHPVAHAGFEEGYLQIANISRAETERGQGPTGRALRTGNIEVARETLADPTFALGREEALKRGYASSITLPLKSKGRVLGGIMIYSVEPDAFDPAEVALLAELADDLAYGVQALRTRAAHQRLEEENAYLASIVESSDDAIIGKSLEGVIQSWNAGAEKLYGYTSSEAVGKSILLIIPPERQAEFEEFLQAIKRGEKIRHHDTVRLTKDGRRIDVAVSISPLKNSSGQLFGASSVARDITERKRAEAALVEERHLLHTLMDNLPDLIYFKDLAGRFTRINLAHAEGFGLSDPAEALGRSDFDFFAPDHARKAYEDEQEIIQTGKPMVGKEEKEVWPDGHVSWVSTTKMPLRDTNGNIIGTFGVSRDITEHKRAEEALQESEERFRSLVENATVGIYRTTPEGRILMANPTLISMLGFQDFAELASRDLENEGFEPGYARHHFRERMERDGEVRGLEDAWVKVNGEAIFVRESARAVRNKEGRILWYDGIVEDITAERRKDRDLRASEIRYRRLFEAARDGILILDAETGVIKDVNPFLTELLGFTEAEILGKKLWDIGPLRHAHLSKISFAQLQSKGFIRYEDLPLETHDGRHINVEFVSNTYLVDEKKVIQCNIRDITERRRTEAEHARLVTAIEQSAEAVVITDTSGKIQYVNPAFTRITGYGREEALGQDISVLKSGKHDAEFYQQLWQTILKGQHWQGELINQRKNGSLYTEQMSITPVRDESGNLTHFVATKQDVTERKALEAQLQQAGKMEAVGRLAGGVAHDFNDLLTVINGYSEMLLERFAADPKVGGYLKEINDVGARAAGLTGQLLAFSRRQVLAPQVLNLNALVLNLEKMLRRVIGEDVELYTVLHPNLGRIKADPGQLEQVIVNLAVNARDAMPMGGHLSLETANVELDEEYTRMHPTVKPGPHVMLGVGDTGVGMSPETQARIFEPFFTTKGQGKGTGLGLATVYGIVKQSEGSIWVYSEPDRGTLFKIYFPMVNEDPGSMESENVKRESASGTETILVVEDEEGVRTLVSLALAYGGYKVLEAVNDETALQSCSKHDGPIHLLLADVVMPGMSGPELAGKVALLRPGIKVLYMSGYTDDAVVRRGILTHEMPFIQKPFSPIALRRKIREVLDRHAH